MAPWNRRNTPPDEFDNTPDNELVAGRFMYDFAHWQSALMIRPSQYAVFNSPSAPVRPVWQNPAPGRGWKNHGLDHALQQPDYNKLLNNVPFLGPRRCDTDPPPPVRDCGSFYLIGTYSAECMGTLPAAGANFIREDADPNPDVVREESTLDTLYFTLGGTAPYGRPMMTYYHGFESPQMVFSGFPLWFFQRAQARALADFVLRDIFGLTRSPSTVAPARVRAAALTLPSPSTVVSARRAAAPQRR